MKGCSFCRVFKVVSMKATYLVTTKIYMTRIIPVGFFMAATLHFGNLVYFHLTVSFIQMLKAFTPVITMLFLFAARLENPNRSMICSVLVVACGTGGPVKVVNALSYLKFTVHL